MYPSEKKEFIDSFIKEIKKYFNAGSVKKNDFLSNFFNSSFVVTVLGGVILWALSAYWQAEQKEIEFSRDKFLREYTRKQEVMIELSNNLPYTLNLAKHYKSRENWLGTNKANAKDKNLFYPDGRNFIETRKYYEDTLQEFYKRKSVYALDAEIRSTYDNENIQKLSTDLASSMNNLQTAKDANEIRKYINLMDDIYRDLIFYMGQDLSGGDKQ
jgi:uncharacterized protein with gpF-like domain